MDIDQGNMAALFQGLRGSFRDVLAAFEPPDVARLVTLMPSTTHTERYPSALLLGDLEELLDEVAMTNIARFIQSVANVDYARAVEIPRAHIEDDQIGMYTEAVKQLAALAASHPFRMLPFLFMSSDGTATGAAGGGFQTAWVDGANQFSNAHAWPGAIAWDNLDSLPLTATNFALVVRHLEQRLGPHGRPLGLKAKLLVVGPRQKVNAQLILHRALIGAGNTNIHFEECDLLVWSEIADDSWFVIDDRGLFGKPCVIQNRTGPDFISQTSLESDAYFDRHSFRYQAARRYGEAIVCPWVVQAVNWDAATMSTTTPAA